MKAIYIFLGFLSLSLGILGAMLPILPTTPFLLLTLYFFAKGSERLHNWFLDTKIYQKHLKSFHESRSLTRKSKAIILSFATAMLLCGLFFTPVIWAKWLIAGLLVIKYWFFFFWVKTVEPEANS